MWLDNFLMVAQWRFPSFGARLLSILAWSTATLNHRPQQDWLVCFEEQVRLTMHGRAPVSGVGWIVFGCDARSMCAKGGVG